MFQNTSTFQQTSAFSGPPTQLGGLFGSSQPMQTAQPALSGFGTGIQSSNGTGLFNQTQQTIAGGLFGQQPQQNTNGFGVQSQQPQQNTSSFGGLLNQPSQPQASSGGLFNALQQTQTSGFNNLTQPGFGAQPQSSAFGVQTQPGLFGQQQNTSQFGQPSYGQQPVQAQSGFQQPLGGGFATVLGGALQGFNNQSGFNNLSGSKPQGFLGQDSSGQNLQGFQQQANTMLYSDSQYYPQQIGSINAVYQPKSVQVEGTMMTFQSNKIQPNLERISTQMLRIADMLQSKGQPAVNYEFVASQEYLQQPQKYVFSNQILQLGQDSTLAKDQKQRTVTQIGQQSQYGSLASSNAMGYPQQQQQSNQQNAWGGNTGQTSGWQQPPPQNLGLSQSQPGMYGYQQQTNGAGGLFGQSQGIGGGLAQPSTGGGLFNKPQVSQPSGGLFAQQPQLNSLGIGMGGGLGSSSTGLFGQNNQQQQQPLGGGGLFGQQPAQTQTAPGLGLFGQNTAQQPAPGGGLFGINVAPKPNIQVNVGGGLFGNQSQAPTGGLFGTQPQTAQQPVGGGLFGQTPQPAQGGLFGSQPQAQPAGGLFGSQLQAQPAGGLFAPKPATGGLFSSQPGQPMIGTGGLFNNQQPQQQMTGGLFGPPTGGLFAQTPNTQLGMQQQQQQQQHTAAPSPYVDLYGSKDPLGFENSFIQKDHPMENIQKEIEAFSKCIEAQYLPKANSNAVASTYESLEQGNLSSFSQPQLKKFQSSTIFEEEATRQRAKEQAKYEKMMQNQQKARQELRNVVNPINLYRKDQNFMSKTTMSSQSSQRQKPDLSQHINKLLATSSVDCAINSETYKIKVVFNFQDTEYSETFDIHKSRDTSDLLQRVMQWLKDDFKYNENASTVEVSINGNLIKEKQSLSDARLLDFTTLEVRIPSLQPRKELISRQNLPNLEIINSELIPMLASELIPKKPKEGYICDPSFDQLEKMTAKQLHGVQNFKITNQFGSVQFFGETDVIGVDLADVVTISQGMCEVYDDERHEDSKPEVGKKLNRPALITLQNMKPGFNQTTKEKERKLKAILDKNGDAEHQSYDQISYQWQFTVQHFTKWGEVDDEQMEDSVPQIPQNIPERSAFEEDSDQMHFESKDNEQKKRNDDFRAGIQPTLFKSFDQKENSQGLKQRKIQQPADFPVPRQVVAVPSFVQTLRQAPVVRKNNEISDSNAAILAKIKQRKQVFSKLQPLETEKPDNLETFNYITQNLGMKNFKDLNKSSLVKRGVVRPCFHPLGTGIIQVQGNKIELLKIPEVQPFSLHSFLTQTVKVDFSSEQINQSFQSLSIQSAQNDQQMEAVNEVCRTSFTDEFFRKMLETPLAEASLFSGRKSINEFLWSTASHYSKEIQSLIGQEQIKRQNRQNLIVRLEQEFNVICILNALFGNPNVHLVQLHHSFTGPKNIDRAKHLSTEITEDSIIMIKKRRNAVTEVLKFVCELKFPVQQDPTIHQKNDSTLYKTALEFLKIGDLRRCVKFLNANRMTKLSLVVSQSVSNTAAMDVLRHQINENDQANNGLSDVLEFITGQSKGIISWEQTFLSALMYEKCHTESLSTIISQQEQRNKNEDSLLWKILRVYARIKQSEEAIWAMNGDNLLAGQDSRDYRIRWITLLILRKALAVNQVESQINQNEQWIPHIPDSVVCDYAVKYIHQLLAQKNDEPAITEACLVAYLIPIAKYRKRVLFEILMCKPEHIQPKVSIPEKYLQTAKAIKFQSSGQSSRAIETWLEVGNNSQAELILTQDYLPLRLPFSSDLTTILRLYRPANLFSGDSTTTAVVKSQPTLDQNIDKIRQKYASNQVWLQTLCGLYKRTRKVLSEMTTVERADYDLIQRELSDVLCALEGSQDYAKSFVGEWIRIQLSEVTAVLAQKAAVQVKESRKSIDGLPTDQAKRYCSQIMQEGIVQLWDRRSAP